jgi:hypothetical protein
VTGPQIKIFIKNQLTLVFMAQQNRGLSRKGVNSEAQDKLFDDNNSIIIDNRDNNNRE